jgi:hypothetical protein
MGAAYLQKLNIYMSQTCMTKFKFDLAPQMCLKSTGMTRTLTDYFSAVVDPTVPRYNLRYGGEFQVSQ